MIDQRGLCYQHTYFSDHFQRNMGIETIQIEEVVSFPGAHVLVDFGSYFH